MERVGLLRYSGTALRTVGPETENDREPMNSLTESALSTIH